MPILDCLSGVGMRGVVAKALRKEAAAQDVPVRKLKKRWHQLDHRARGKWRAVLGVYAAVRNRL